MTLGSTVKGLRTAAGFNQKEFAAQLEISPAYLSQIESDSREPTIPLLRRMADKLGSPAAILFAVAIASKLPADNRERELEVIQRLIDAVTLNISSKQLSFGLRDAG
jgi:transcriptional regulator with XRE-family HTH domain